MSQTLSMNLNCVIDEVNELLSVKLPIFYFIDLLIHLRLNDQCLPCVAIAGHHNTGSRNPAVMMTEYRNPTYQCFHILIHLLNYT